MPRARTRSGTGTGFLRRLGRVTLAGVVALGAGCGEPEVAEEEGAEPWVDGTMKKLNDNGAWSWFMDERVIVHEGKLIVGSVRAIGGREDEPIYGSAGNVEVAVWDLETDEVGTVVLFEKLQQDDHNNPSFLPRMNGGLLAIYTKHRVDQDVYVQYSMPGDPLWWTPPTVFESPRAATGAHAATYSNTFRLPSGRIVNFYRGFEQDPNYMYSDNDGVTWTYGGRLVHGLNGYSPYLKYAQDSKGAIHFVATEDHPRQYDNSLYHGIVDGEELRGSDGTVIAALSKNTAPSADITQLTRIFPGDPDNVAWMTDIEIDEQDRPVVAFTVQKDGRYSVAGQGGHDNRYHHARWDGESWHWHEIAHAGERLYAGEDDYTGLATLDPRDTRVVYISTNVDPVAGDPLISASDGEAHYELFRCVTADDGETWEFAPITRDSRNDNLRPLVPRWDDERTALVWMRGTYEYNSGKWSSAVVAMIRE